MIALRIIGLVVAIAAVLAGLFVIAPIGPFYDQQAQEEPAR